MFRNILVAFGPRRKLHPVVVGEPILVFGNFKLKVLVQAVHLISDVRGVDAADVGSRAYLKRPEEERLLLLAGDKDVVVCQQLGDVNAYHGPFVGLDV